MRIWPVDDFAQFIMAVGIAGALICLGGGGWYYKVHKSNLNHRQYLIQLNIIEDKCGHLTGSKYFDCVESGRIILDHIEDPSAPAG